MIRSHRPPITFEKFTKFTFVDDLSKKRERLSFVIVQSITVLSFIQNVIVGEHIDSFTEPIHITTENVLLHTHMSFEFVASFD